MAVEVVEANDKQAVEIALGLLDNAMAADSLEHAQAYVESARIFLRGVSIPCRCCDGRCY